MSAQECLDLVPRLFERFSRDVRVMPGSQSSGRARTDQQSFLSRHVGQRELVGVQEPRADRASEPFRILGIGFLCHEQVTAE